MVKKTNSFSYFSIVIVILILVFLYYIYKNFLLKQKSLTIGIIDWHGDLTQMLKKLIPSHHTVVVLKSDIKTLPDNIDLLINHHAKEQIERFNVPQLVANCGVTTPAVVEVWNTNPLVKGILDQSMNLKNRFPEIQKPILTYRMVYDENLPIYKESGTKIITLVVNYSERYPEQYRFVKTITNDIYGNNGKLVNDIEALKDAKWLLQIKPNAFVCNAVVKALACGVPVIMDITTWKTGFYEMYIRHNENGIVLPQEDIADYLQNVTEEEYSRIKNTCVSEASSIYRHPPQVWKDSWWLPLNSKKSS